MRFRYYLIREVELLVSFLTCLLAVQSFFNSWLYELLKIRILGLVSSFGLNVLPSSIDVEQALPILISVLFLMITVYNGILGKSGNMLNLYNFNMMLVTPEVFSYSKMNWLNLFDVAVALQPKRDFLVVLVTCLLLVGGYILLYLNSNFRQTLSEIGARGVDEAELDVVLFNQSMISTVLAAVSIAIVASFHFAIPFLTGPLRGALGDIPSIYVVLGVASTLIVTLSLRVFLQERLK